MLTSYPLLFEFVGAFVSRDEINSYKYLSIISVCIMKYILFLGFMQGFSWGQWGGLAVVFSLGQILESYILTPYLVGNKVGLHPVWVIFALLAGGVLAGFLGILIAVPVAAVIGVLVRRGLRWYKKTSFYTGKAERK